MREGLGDSCLGCILFDPTFAAIKVHWFRKFGRSGGLRVPGLGGY